MTALIEKALHAECMLRLRLLPVVAFSVPNSVYLPARTEAERTMAARVIHQMKAAGQLTPGAPDLCVFWGGEHPSGAMIELKRAASRDLLGKRPAGRPSEAQRDMAARAVELGINHAFASSWDDVRDRLTEWGAL